MAEIMKIGPLRLRDANRFLDVLIRHYLHGTHLLSHPPQNPSHFLVPLYESKLGILKPLLLRERLDKPRSGFEIVPRETWKKVMRHLEVEAAMEKSERFGADNVNSCAELAMKEGFYGP